MLNKNLKRLVDLANRTNSPLILTDIEGSDPVVLMSVDQFEELAAEFDPEDIELMGGEDWHDGDPEPALHSHDVHEMPAEFEASIPEDEMFEGEIIEEPTIDVENMGEIALEEQFYLEPIE